MESYRSSDPSDALVYLVVAAALPMTATEAIDFSKSRLVVFVQAELLLVALAAFLFCFFMRPLFLCLRGNQHLLAL